MAGVMSSKKCPFICKNKIPLPFDGKDNGIFLQKLFWVLLALASGIVLFTKVIVISGKHREGF